MYDIHLFGRTYTSERNKKVSEAGKKWISEHPDEHRRKAVKGAIKCRELGLLGHPTQPEKDMEIALKTYGIQYITQYEYGIGIMDFYLPAGNIALFVDGQIWHADPGIYKPDDIMFFSKNTLKIKYEQKTAKDIWCKDHYHTVHLESKGFKVLRFWEKEIRTNIDKCIQIKIQEVGKSLLEEGHQHTIKLLRRDLLHLLPKNLT